MIPSYFCHDENLLKLKEGIIKYDFDRIQEGDIYR